MKARQGPYLTHFVSIFRYINGVDIAIKMINNKIYWIAQLRNNFISMQNCKLLQSNNDCVNKIAVLYIITTYNILIVYLTLDISNWTGNWLRIN